MINNYNLLVEKLRKFSQKYFLLQLVKGLLLLVSILTIYVSCILVLEFNYYTSVTWRIGFFFCLIILACFVFYKYLLSAFFILIGIRKFHVNEQAKLVSSLFPELKDHLINMIELGQMENHGDLILSSIDQKIRGLSPFNFQNYFNFRMIRTNVLVLLVSFGAFSIAVYLFPGLVSSAGYRLFHFTQVFIKPAPFEFVVLNSNMQVKKGSSLELEVKCIGEDAPENLYVNIGGNNFIMSLDDSVFTYRLDHVQNSFPLFFTDLQYSSQKYFVQVVPDPLLLSYNVQVDVPAYTNLPDQELKDVGNLKVPFGSIIKWVFNCADADSLFLRIDNEIVASTKDGDTFVVEYKCLKELEYSVLLSNQYIIRKQLINFNIELIPDLFPQIKVVQYQDSAFLNRFYFKGEIADDYGFHDLVFNIKNLEIDSVTKLPVAPNLNLQEFYYYVDFKGYEGLGDAFSYYFTVADNDYFHHFKQSTSEVFNFQFLSKSELEQADNKIFDDIEGLVNKSKSIAEEIKRDLEEFKYRSISEKLNDWENQQMMQNILDKRKKLQESLNQLKNKNARMNNLNNSFGDQQESLLEKQKQIEQLLDEVMTDELKKLFDEFNELAKNFNQDRFNEMMNRMDFPMEDLSKQLDRNLEMLKRLKIEQQLTNIAQELEDIADREKENLELLEQREFDELSKKESSNKKSVNELADDLNDVFKMNQELDKQMNLFPVDDELNEINENYDGIDENIRQKRKSKLQDQIPQNENSIRTLAFSVSQMLANNAMQQNGEDIENLKQILKNLIYVSLDQEDVLNLTLGLNVNDPLLGVIQKRQDLLLEQSKQIEDSLYALANRTPAVNSKINSELLKIDFSIGQSVQDLKDGLTTDVPKFQQNTITAFNELALLLNEALENLEKAMANSMPGNQECDKPGKSGQSSMQKLKDAQQSLQSQLQQMIESLKKGDQGKLNEQIGKSLIQQEMMKQMIEEMLMDGGVGSPAKEQLRAIDHLIEQNRLDLIQKNISDNMIARQNLILDRLLKAEKSEMERDVDDQRESKTASQIFYSNPDVIFEYKPTEKTRFDNILYNDYRLRKFYENKFRNYMNKVNQ